MDSVFNMTTSPSNGTTVYTVGPRPEVCRDSHGEFPLVNYTTITCALCYIYVYMDHNVSMDDRTYELVTGTNTAYPEGTRMVADLKEESISRVCQSLHEPSECWKWKECCTQAHLCCQEQIATGPKPYQDYGRSTCPSTWDGYACWSDTPAGQTPRTQCPAHVPEAEKGMYAYKTCTKNGTWYLNPLSNKEWTDYTECNTMKHYQRLHRVSLSCTIITIIFLVPACIIFLYYRPLRQQHRIRLHICLMISSCITSVCMLIWEISIFKDVMETESAVENTVNKNSVGCRVLFVLSRYAELASFMWMFIEGFHLHRLLVHTFTVPKALIPYYIFGFGFPILPVTVYTVIRSTSNEFNQKFAALFHFILLYPVLSVILSLIMIISIVCWINQADHYEWIISLPSLLALATNVFFLIRIVFIMVRQLEPHPNEPGNFRRAVKAVVVLVPLFGLQLLLFLYRPPKDSPIYELSELLNKMCSSLQGAFIAIIFCYLNKEVQGYLKISCRRLCRHGGRKDVSSRSYTVSTQYLSELSRTRTSNGNCDMMALRPICNSQHGDEPVTKESSVELINGNLHTIAEHVDEDPLLSHDKRVQP